MANTVIQLKKSSTPSATPADLANGEIAINYADGKLYYKNLTGQIVSISGGGGAGGNSFGTVVANGTLLVADTTNDYLTINQGDNIIIVGDALTDTFTINANLISAYSHANTVGTSANAYAASLTPDLSPAFNKANDAYLIANTAFDKANAANLLAYGTGIGANAYSDTVGTAANNHAGVMANAANAYAASLTPDLTAANNWANTKLSNTSGVMFEGTLNIKTNLSVGNNITTSNTLTFSTASSIAVDEGQVTWNPDESTLDVGLANSSVLQVGQEILYRVKNQTGSTITEGTVVMAAGTLGASGRILVAPAVSDGTYPSKYLMGIATGNIADGADGYVTAFGKVRGIDTSMWSEGDILYANVSVAGGLQNTAPTAPNTKTTVAIVISKHASTGTLFVRPTYGSKLNEDELVELSSLTNGDVLVYSSTPGRFENKVQLALNAGSVDGLTANTIIEAANGYSRVFANTVGTAGNANLSVATVAANTFAGTMANAANAFASTIVTANLATAKSYADTVVTANLATAKSYADTVVVANLAIANAYSRVFANSVGTAGNSYTDTVVTSNLATAKSYSDTVVLANLAIANAYSRTFANTVGTSANAYTDTVLAANVTGANNYVSATYTANTVGGRYLGTANNADLLDGNHASYFLANATGTLAGALTTTGNLIFPVGYFDSTSLQMGSSTQFYPQLTITNFRNDAYGPYWNTQKSRANGAVVSGDTLGTHIFRGHDGTQYLNSSYMASIVDGTVATNIVPSRLDFQTTNSSGVFVHSLTLTSNGNVAIGRYTANYPLDVVGTVNASSVLVNGTVVTLIANNYAGVMANSVNANLSVATIAANNYAGAMANSVNANLSISTIAANNFAGAMANAANANTSANYLAKVGGTVSGDLVITGNLTISGNTTYANTQTLLIGDNILTLNADIPNNVAPSENAGLEVNRGNKNSNAAIIWNETACSWMFTSNTQTNYTTAIASNTSVDNAGATANTYAGTMVSANLATAKSYSDTVVTANLATAKSYSDTVVTANLATAKSYSDTVVTANLATAKSYSDTVVVANLAIANAYTRTFANTVGAAANVYADTVVTANLVSAKGYANTYTDTVVLANVAVANAYSRVFANSVGTAANANLSVGTIAANTFAGTMANASNSFASTIVTANLATAKSYSDTVVTANLATAKSYSDTVVLANLAIANAYTRTFANTKLANTSGVVFDGDLNISGNVNVDSATLFVDKNANKVGIGSSTPTNLLTVEGGVTEIRTGGYLMLRPSDNNWDMRLQSNTGNKLNVLSGGDLGNAIMTFVHGGNVGIGNTAPQSKLHVAGSVTLDNNYYLRQYNSTGTVYNILGVDTSNTTRLYSASGILHLNPDASSGSTYLNYNSPGFVQVGDGTNLVNISVSKGVISTVSPNTGARWVISGKTLGKTNDSGLYQDGANNMQLAARDGSNNLRVVIDANTSTVSYINVGNVGIGTTTPTSKLDVNGIFNVGDGNQRINMYFSSGAYLLNKDNTKFYIGANNSTTQLVLDPTTSAYVGIGTASPVTKLHVKGTWVNNEGILQIDADSGTQYSGLTMQNNGTVKYYIYNDNTNAINYIGSAGTEPLVFGYNATSEWMRLNSTGLGIGNTSPSSKLVVNATSTTAASLTWDAAAGQILRNENSELAIGLHNANPYPLYMQGRTSASAARNLSLQPLGGSVGIGKYDPGYTLDVNGTSGFSSTITLPSGAGTNQIQAGTGDGASFTTYNIALRSWWGIGFKDYTDSSTVKAFLDCRTGNFSTAGTVNASSVLINGGSVAPSASPTFTGTVNFNANNAFQTLTDAASIAWDASLGQVATVTLGGNRALANATNLKVGTYILHVIQDGSGSRTLSFGSQYKWPGGVAPTMTTTIGARDVLSFISDGTLMYGSFLPDVK